MDVDRITKFIISCCVLHNICMEANDMPEDISTEESLQISPTSEFVEQLQDGSERSVHLRRLAEIKRNEMCNGMI